MERHITINDKIIERISFTLHYLFDTRPRHREHHLIPNDADLSQVSFSFGQYKGKLINQIWKIDKRYIKKLSKQDWLGEYPLEELAVHTLLENQRLFR